MCSCMLYMLVLLRIVLYNKELLKIDLFMTSLIFLIHWNQFDINSTNTNLKNKQFIKLVETFVRSKSQFLNKP